MAGPAEVVAPIVKKRIQSLLHWMEPYSAVAVLDSTALIVVVVVVNLAGTT